MLESGIQSLRPLLQHSSPSLFIPLRNLYAVFFVEIEDRLSVNSGFHELVRNTLLQNCEIDQEILSGITEAVEGLCEDCRFYGPIQERLNSNQIDPSVMSRVDVDGVSLFYTEKGAGEPVLFVHGIPTDYRVWSSQLEALSGRFRAISYSRRYAYPNIRKGDVLDSTIENNAADLVGLLGKLGISQVHLVGHSYGGFIAAFLANYHPELIRSLVLVEPFIPTLLLRNQNSKTEQLSLLLRHPSVAFAALRALRKSEPAIKAYDRGDIETVVRINLDIAQNKNGALEQLPEEQRKMMLDNGRTYKEVTTPFPLLRKEDLKKIRSPTLVVNGESSNLLLRRIAQMAASSIPGCKRVRITGSGHYPHIEKPAEFNSQLLEFLQP